jgi:hypothetical protein
MVLVNAHNNLRRGLFLSNGHIRIGFQCDRTVKQLPLIFVIVHQLAHIVVVRLLLEHISPRLQSIMQPPRRLYNYCLF